MAITNEDIVALASAFHDASMVKKSTAAEMAEFFLYPESRIFVLHGGRGDMGHHAAQRRPRAGAGYRLLAGTPRRLGRRRAAQNAMWAMTG
jgi:hypothetical protein